MDLAEVNVADKGLRRRGQIFALLVREASDDVDFGAFAGVFDAVAGRVQDAAADSLKRC